MADDTPTPAPPAPSGPAPLPLPKGVVTRVDPAALIEEAKADKAALVEASLAISQLPTRRSATLGKLTLALSKAQGKIKSAIKSADNPFFKSKYADLDACWDACREALSENELAVFQPIRSNGRIVVITTLLAHSSDEWIEESLTLIAAQDTPQGIVAASTYGRRCALSGMVGISAADDDGNEASRDLPKDTHWDKANTKLQRDQPKPAVQEGPAAIPVPQREVAPRVTTGVASSPEAAGPPPPVARPIARPKGVTVPSVEAPPVSTAIPAGGLVSPPPPGMKPPQRME